MTVKTKYKLILGSKSPRRSQLLSDAGLSFEIRVNDTDERYPDDMDVYQVASYLAEIKAQALEDQLKEDEILLCADSIVILNNKIYGKPKDKSDAFNILNDLSGKTHTVVTGICLMSKTKKITLDDRTEVTFEKLNAQEIEYYIDKFQPFDKAGSYGIQDWIGLCKVRSISGSHANVMGLPVHLVYESLKSFQ